MLSLWNKENRNLASTASTPYMAQTLYSLTCFLIGSDGTFQVKIDRTELVGNLKDAIKEKKPVALKDVDADQLTLYKINVDVNATDKNTYILAVQDISQDLSNSQKATELNPVDELSEVFETGPPPKKKIHILVTCPAGESIKAAVCGPVAETAPRCTR